MPSVEASEIYGGLKGKLLLWLALYLDASNDKTYMNGTASAMAAGYKRSSYKGFGVQGSENLRKLAPRIQKWLDEEGLSENRLKLKLASLLEAKETKIKKIKGKLTEDKPGDDDSNVRTIVTSDEESIVGIELPALDIQQRAVDMGLKIHGSYNNDVNVNLGIDKLAERLAQAKKEIFGDEKQCAESP